MAESDVKKINLKARVISTHTFCTLLPPHLDLSVGDVVTLTRDERHLDGTVATDIPGTWGIIGKDYELLEE